ncbi:MAG TPA: alpha-1,4-glucan--maltose-1-phosphate maltosyltransferase [Candidatus Caenarcaniphilales bacterium]|nr:alpha-1,4-glucan--maltose-1-phosphate maltosyltransferase [Candidatus Caenarcaniphilales bacterium]
MTDLPGAGRQRVVIENVSPQVDGGRFPVKRVVGDELTVEVDAFVDGHDEIRVVLRWCAEDRRANSAAAWHETEMEPLGNDRWRGSFPLDKVGRYAYTVCGWIDHFRTWRRDLAKRLDAGQDVAIDMQIGAELLRRAAARAEAVGAHEDARRISESRTVDDAVAEVVERYPDRAYQTSHERELEVVVDRERGRFSSWYELFPRSASPDPERHGTFADVIARLPYVAQLGFDVLYLPPIHPIGRQFRKGPNNVTTAGPGDPGVPWAIGGPEGGHTAIHPDLGTLDDFRSLVQAAETHGIEIALDVAFQASPDHPWVKEHPDWFRARPDGTIQYAENPPKKYQDIYPFDFESEDWTGLWRALNDVFRFWIGHGVRIFRVDNPHTKPFPFWEWLLDDLKRDHPDVLLLAEAFTRPKVMYRLAKLGFSQSYTYFTWRNTKQDLTDYFTELTQTSVREFFRPNAWPNTPDILHEVLQAGGRPAFEARVVLAATLSANYGIYGAAYELGENTPREPGSEEYLNSEKYQQRTWDLDRPDSLRELIARLNRARREHAALHSNERLWFHPIDNDQLIAYTKNTSDRSDIILTVVSLDFHAPQAGTLELGLEGLGLPIDAPFEAVDLLSGTTQRWHGPRVRLELDPARLPARVFHLRSDVRDERQFEFYR